MLQPALYSANNQVANQCARIVVEKYKHLIKWNKTPSIFEFGVGDGRTSAEVLFPKLFPRDYEKYVGTDKSSVMLKHAKQLLPTQKCEFFELDIFKDVPSKLFNKFDFVVSFLTLHWGTDTRKAVDNIYKMLKPGGQTLNVTFTEAPNDEAYEKLSENPKWSIYDHKTILTPYYKNPRVGEVYKRHFEDGGFTNCWIELEEFAYEFANRKEYESLYTSLNRVMPKIPPRLIEEYLKDYLDALLQSRLWSTKQLRNSEEHVEMIMKLLVTYGRKLT